MGTLLRVLCPFAPSLAQHLTPPSYTQGLRVRGAIACITVHKKPRTSGEEKGRPQGQIFSIILAKGMALGNTVYPVSVLSHPSCVCSLPILCAKAEEQRYALEAELGASRREYGDLQAIQDELLDSLQAAQNELELARGRRPLLTTNAVAGAAPGLGSLCLSYIPLVTWVMGACAGKRCGGLGRST